MWLCSRCWRFFVISFRTWLITGLLEYFAPETSLRSIRTTAGTYLRKRLDACFSHSPSSLINTVKCEEGMVLFSCWWAFTRRLIWKRSVCKMCWSDRFRKPGYCLISVVSMVAGVCNRSRVVQIVLCSTVGRTPSCKHLCDFSKLCFYSNQSGTESTTTLNTTLLSLVATYTLCHC